MNAMPTVLIVEANPVFRQALKTTIQSRFPELNVIATDNADDALRKSVSERPKLVVMDIHLRNNGGKGLDLIRQIAVAQPYARIAVLTDSDDDAYRQAALGKGADYFISKISPGESRKVLTMIRETLK